VSNDKTNLRRLVKGLFSGISFLSVTSLTLMLNMALLFTKVYPESQCSSKKWRTKLIQLWKCLDNGAPTNSLAEAVFPKHYPKVQKRKRTIRGCAEPLNHWFRNHWEKGLHISFFSFCPIKSTEIGLCIMNGALKLAAFPLFLKC